MLTYTHPASHPPHLEFKVKVSILKPSQKCIIYKNIIYFFLSFNGKTKEYHHGALDYINPVQSNTRTSHIEVHSPCGYSQPSVPISTFYIGMKTVPFQKTVPHTSNNSYGLSYLKSKYVSIMA